MVGAGGEPVDLARTLNSHGFVDLAPMALDEAALLLECTIRVPGGSDPETMSHPQRWTTESCSCWGTESLTAQVCRIQGSQIAYM